MKSIYSNEPYYYNTLKTKNVNTLKVNDKNPSYDYSVLKHCKSHDEAAFLQDKENSFFSSRKKEEISKKNAVLRKALKNILKNNTKTDNQEIIPNSNDSVNYKNFLSYDYKQNIEDYCSKIKKINQRDIKSKRSDPNFSKILSKSNKSCFTEDETFENRKKSEKFQNLPSNKLTSFFTMNKNSEKSKLEDISFFKQKDDNSFFFKQKDDNSIYKRNDIKKMEASFSIDKSLLIQENNYGAPDIKTSRFSNEKSEELENKIQGLILEKQRLEKENKEFIYIQEKWNKEKINYEKTISTLNEKINNKTKQSDLIIWKKFEEITLNPFLEKILGNNMKGNLDNKVKILGQILDKFDNIHNTAENNIKILNLLKKKIKVENNNQLIEEIDKILIEKKKTDSIFNLIKSNLL